MTLTFRHLREVNVARCVEGWNHPLAAWSLDEWATAVVGEFGEACNVLKKLHRDRDGLIGNDKPASLLRADFADELADAVIYIDLYAARGDVVLFPGASFADLLEANEIKPFLSRPPSAHMHTAWRAMARATEQMNAMDWHLGVGDEAATIVAREEACEYMEAAITSLAAAARHPYLAINLGGAVVDKFNRTSVKHGMSHRLVPA